MLKHVGIQIPVRGFIYYLFICSARCGAYSQLDAAYGCFSTPKISILVVQNVEVIYSQLRMIWF